MMMMMMIYHTHDCLLAHNHRPCNRTDEVQVDHVGSQMFICTAHRRPVHPVKQLFLCISNQKQPLSQ